MADIYVATRTFLFASQSIVDQFLSVSHKMLLLQLIALEIKSGEGQAFDRPIEKRRFVMLLIINQCLMP